MYLSIILVNWNGKIFLPDCIRSLRQNIENIEAEIIVVDNASTDQSQNYIAENHPNIKLIQLNENMGFAKANNIGIKVSKGEYLLLVNTDVIVGRDCIKKMISYMKHHSNVGMMGPKVKFPDGTLQLTCMERLSLWNTLCRALALDRYMPRSRIFAKYKMSYWSYDEIREVDVINGCFWLLSREAINVVGMLDERFFIYGEDIDWAIRFNNAGFKVVYYPNAEIIHYGGGSSANAPVRFYVEMNKANYELWKKYNKNYTHIIYAIIICMHQLLRILGYGVLKYVNNSLRNEYEYKIKRCVACIKWLFAELTGVNDNQIKA